MRYFCSSGLSKCRRINTHGSKSTHGYTVLRGSNGQDDVRP